MQRSFLVPCVSFIRNLKSSYFTLSYINKGFVLALALSNFIFVEILSSKFDGLIALAAEFFSPLIAIAALFYLLKANKAEWFWCGFFIGALWMHWISFSLIYFNLAFLIPLEILGICLVYAFIFRIFAIFDAPVLRAACLLILKFIHPFGFDWLNFELLLSHGIFRADLSALALILAGLCAVLYLRGRGIAVKLNAAIFAAFLICALQFSQKEPEPLPIKISLANTDISQYDIWAKDKILSAALANLARIDDAIAAGQDAIILPESAFAMPLNLENVLVEALKEKSRAITIVAGAEAYENGKFYNSAYLFANGEMSRFDKHILVPFGEMVPLPEFARNFINRVLLGGATDFSTASGFSDYELGGKSVRSAVCYEATRAELYEGSPKYVVAISNNGWFVPSYEPYLQRLIIRYYASLHGTMIYHVVNGSASEIIAPKKIWINRLKDHLK